MAGNLVVGIVKVNLMKVKLMTGMWDYCGEGFLGWQFVSRIVLSLVWWSCNECLLDSGCQM